MIGELLILGTASKIAKKAIEIEYLKSKHLKLSDEEKRDILNDENRSFIHFTTEENAKNIMKSGYIIPTKGIVNNHFSTSMNAKGKREFCEKVYMFDSKNFSVEDYIRNLPRKHSPYVGCYTFNAISMKPNEYNINSFSRRAIDGTITYEGRLDLSYTNTRAVKYALDLDENDKYIMKEIGLDEEYIPSNELLEKIEKTKCGNIKYGINIFLKELKNTKSAKIRYKANKDKYKEQINKRRNFAKANRQLLNEEKQIDRVYNVESKSLVVRKSGYEIIDGKRLQKVEVLGNGFENSDKNVDEVSKCFYMDDIDFDAYDSKDMAQYFRNNYEHAINNSNKFPEYIGMPLKVLDNGNVINEYDEKFRTHYVNKVNASEISGENFYKTNSVNKMISKLKSFFYRITGRSSPKMLSAPVDPNLKKFGVNSIEELNRYDPNIQILESSFEDILGKLTNDESNVINSDIQNMYNRDNIESNRNHKEIKDGNRLC